MNKDFLAIMSTQAAILEILLRISKGEKLSEEEETCLKKLVAEINEQLILATRG